MFLIYSPHFKTVVEVLVCHIWTSPSSYNLKVLLQTYILFYNLTIIRIIAILQQNNSLIIVQTFFENLAVTRDSWSNKRLRVLPKSRRQLVLIEHLLKCRSTKCLYETIIFEFKLQDRYDKWKYFCMNGETHFLISRLQFDMTFFSKKIMLSLFYSLNFVFCIFTISTIIVIGLQ